MVLSTFNERFKFQQRRKVGANVKLDSAAL